MNCLSPSWLGMPRLGPSTCPPTSARTSGGAGVTLSNADCYFMQLGHSTTEVLDEKTPLVRALVGGQVDGPSLGIPNQDGDKQFMQRFALQTHAGFDPAAAMRFALEHQNRLITGPVAVGVVAKQGQYPADQFSLLRLSNPDVLAWAVKPAEEGIDKGMIVRMWNVADHPNECALRLWRPFTAAQRTTHIETDLAPAAVEQGGLQASFTSQQMQTFRVVVAAGEK
jgi:alpha-mannosidase